MIHLQLASIYSFPDITHRMVWSLLKILRSGRREISEFSKMSGLVVTHLKRISSYKQVVWEHPLNASRWLSCQLVTLLFAYLHLFWVRQGSAQAVNANKSNTCNPVCAGGELSGFLQSFSDLFIFILHIYQAITSALGWERGMTPVYSTHNYPWLSKFIPRSCKSSVFTQTNFTPVVKTSAVPENVSWPWFCIQ